MKMIAIYKYSIPILTAPVTLDLPKGAIIRYVDMQDGNVTLWIQVETTKVLQRRNFMVFGTGEQIAINQEDYDDNWVFIGTVLDHSFVWHVFEKL
jgi:hypothetical protein